MVLVVKNFEIFGNGLKLPVRALWFPHGPANTVVQPVSREIQFPPPIEMQYIYLHAISTRALANGCMFTKF